MSFKKPSRAVPLQLSADRVNQVLQERRSRLVKDGTKAVAGGAALGIAAFAVQAGGLTEATEVADWEPVEQTQLFDHSVYWPNCDSARAAGVAPLHHGDFGYRAELDRDADGVACEPITGQ